MARSDPEIARISAVTHDGSGIADVPGKKVFVAGALAGELVRFQRRKRRRKYDEAELLEVLEASPSRVEPRCAVFGRCGGCSLQHIGQHEQRAIKQQALRDSLERIGRVSPEEWLPALYAEGEDGGWHYRRRARLAVKDVAGKGRVLVGFRERHAPYVTDMHRCEVLARPVDSLIDPLSELISGLSIRARLPQIEVAAADNAVELVFRVLDPPSGADRERLADFARRYGIRVALQPGGLDSLEPLWPAAPADALGYAMADHDVRIEFGPIDFVQVNAAINRRMVNTAIELLDVRPEHRVLDLFCGIGNFTLPLARRAASVVGVEGESAQVERARLNAQRNGIDNAEFVRADLFAVSGREPWLVAGCDRMLLDPARAGALELVQRVGVAAPARIVYVSCHPGTLARDAGELVRGAGYRLRAAGIIDMFPHTNHVESIALFEKKNKNN